MASMRGQPKGLLLIAQGTLGIKTGAVRVDSANPNHPDGAEQAMKKGKYNTRGLSQGYYCRDETP